MGCDNPNCCQQAEIVGNLAALVAAIDTLSKCVLLSQMRSWDDDDVSAAEAAFRDMKSGEPF